MALLLNFVDGVNDGGVMFAAEGSADLRKRGIGQLFDQVHGYLARIDQFLSVAFFLKLRLLNLEPFTHRFLDRKSVV